MGHCCQTCGKILTDDEVRRWEAEQTGPIYTAEKCDKCKALNKEDNRDELGEEIVEAFESGGLENE